MLLVISLRLAAFNRLLPYLLFIITFVLISTLSSCTKSWAHISAWDSELDVGETADGEVALNPTVSMPLGLFVLPCTRQLLCDSHTYIITN